MIYLAGLPVPDSERGLIILSSRRSVQYDFCHVADRIYRTGLPVLIKHACNEKRLAGCNQLRELRILKHAAAGARIQ